MKDKLNFPRFVLDVLFRLNDAGFEAYIVGGAVRDAISGMSSDDYDITTNARTEEVEKVFHDANIIETGIKHGTVTVVLDGVSYEITTFRTDGTYSDVRHPDSVSFVGDISEDLSRRDFTINAMAYSEKTGIVDLFGGREDLENKVIRAVGDPIKRFNEDALRILRAVRFASKLGFTIEKTTLDAMKTCVNNVRSLSVERIFVEITKTLCGEFRYFALHEYSYFLFAVVPEIQPEYMFDQMNNSHKYDVYEHTLHAIEFCDKVTPVIMWALLFHDSGKPYTTVYGTDNQRHFPKHWEVSSEFAGQALERMKAPKEFTREVKFLAFYHDDYFHGGKATIKRFFNKYGEKYMLDMCAVKRADWLSHSDYGVKKYEPFYNRFNDDVHAVIENGECYSVAQLDVNGNDVAALGFSGKIIGKILSDVLDRVIDEKLENKKEKIITYIKSKW